MDTWEFCFPFVMEGWNQAVSAQKSLLLDRAFESCLVNTCIMKYINLQFKKLYEKYK